jgi:hypothetical protein
MDLSALLSTTRIKLDDTTAPYLWSDVFLTAALNDAVREACDRAWLIKDSETPEVAQLVIPAGTRTADLHPEIIAVSGARRAHDGYPVCPTDPPELAMRFGGLWEMDAVPREVEYFYVTGNQLGVYPLPQQTITLNLSVSRLPLPTEEMVDPTDTPVILPRYHRKLIDWALSEAWGVSDSDSSHAKLAAAAAERFDRSFGRAVSAKHVTKRAQTLVRTAYFRPFGRVNPSSVG